MPESHVITITSEASMDLTKADPDEQTDTEEQK